MKTLHLTCLLLALGLTSAAAGLITRSQTFTPNTALNDGTGLGNEFDQATTLFSDLPGVTLANVTVQLDLAGGFNGQLFAYLAKGVNGFCVLLNRPGRDSGNPAGYIDPGLDITLSDPAPNGDVHVYTPNNQATRLTGTWAPDGRESDPNAVVTSDVRSALLGSFIGETADGTWVLYVEDMVTGQQATLNSWTLNLQVDAVPEPATWATMGVMLCGVAGYIIHRRRAAAA